MSGNNYAALSQARLFARLAQGLAGGVTVLTPNQRLAQALAREFDAAQAAQGRSAWESADILPYAAFVGRCYEDALYSESGSGLPILLTPAQEHALWEDIIRRSDAGDALLAIPETAALAADAWNTAHAWRLLASLRSGELNEDATAFRDWCAAYSLRCERERHTDTALLPDLVAAQLSGAALRKPKWLVLYGFDIMTPQQRALFDALRAAGTEVFVSAQERREASVLRLACVDARDEINRAAAWARARLEADPQAHIGIVVPDLAQQRKALVRAFRRVMAPASILPGAGAGAAAVQRFARRGAHELSAGAGGVPDPRARRARNRIRAREPAAALAVHRGGRERGRGPRAARSRIAPPRRTFDHARSLARHHRSRRRRRARARAGAAPAQTGAVPQVRPVRRARALGLGQGDHRSAQTHGLSRQGPQPRFGRVPDAEEMARSRRRLRAARSRARENGLW